MKRYLLCLLALSSIGCFSFLGLNAQTPGAIYFQAEARDSKGKILKEAALSVTIGIQDDTTSNIFIREQDFDVITDKYGLFTIVFGNPNISEDDFLYIYDLNGLDWGEEPLFVRPIISYKGETNYLSAIEILSVPYAFYSGKAHSALRADEVDWLDIDNMPPDFADGNDDVNDADADPENELITMAVLNGTNLEITDAGGTNTVDLSSISGETPSNTTYSIGLNESVGGYIFYITPDGKHGLVAGAQDASVSFYNWYYASDHCDMPAFHNSIGQNFMDWRLPKSWEMVIMMRQRDDIGGFSADTYWCSTEWNNTDADYCKYDEQAIDHCPKTEEHCFRPIREF